MKEYLKSDINKKNYDFLKDKCNDKAAWLYAVIAVILILIVLAGMTVGIAAIFNKSIL